MISTNSESTYPMMRIFVDQKVVDDAVSRGNGKVVDVNQEVEMVKNDILLFEKGKKYIEQARRISVMDCACRIHIKLHNDGVPVNLYLINVCMNFNTWADYNIEFGFRRELTKKEALETLTTAAKAGIDHTTQYITEKSTFICNCDRDCCVMLRGIRQFNNPNIIASSNFLPQYEIENCVFCKKCTEFVQ
ncbi:MAG: hypothetical protein ACFFG0_48955 [Candidatus Thorarchaeota archaeon]